MKRSFVYYYAKIKQLYPEISKIKQREYERINNEIYTQIRNGEEVTAHRQLFDKTLYFLGRLAYGYAENGLDSATFEDNLSKLQLKIMHMFDKKVKKGIWYKDWNSFLGSGYFYPLGILKQLIKQQEQEEQPITEEIICNKAKNDFYEKLLNEMSNDELKVYFSEMGYNLTPHELFNVNNYYGINGYYPHSIQNLATMQNITRQRVSKIIITATEKISKAKSDILRDFYYTQQ